MTDTEPKVTPIENGAHRVNGLSQLDTDDGSIELQSIVALCRCGRSANKPFCDGTHAKIGFSSADQGGPAPDQRDDYAGKQVTIHDNRDICAGAGFCTSGLPTVFDMKGVPWIDADGDTAQKIIDTVRKCPSGALSYSVDGVEHRDPTDRPPGVEVVVAGPYRVTGGCELEGAEWAAGASKEHYSLCRCGGSTRKPFCDGSHWTVWKDGEATRPPATEAKGPRPTTDEPYLGFIHDLAVNGLSKFGPDGPMTAMGVPRTELPTWDHIQIMAAQLDPRPLQEGEHVGTELVIGPRAKKPLHLDIPLFVSDMSYGALSEEAKVSLSKGAELAGTGICSGEGGMLPEEQAANSRYFYEYASGKFGFEEKKLTLVQAMHFKCGQGAKTGTGGHLPGSKVVGKIAEVRGLKPGTESISPSAFTDLITPADFKEFADRAREVSGGIPIGFKMSGNRIERDIDFALAGGADYIILDGRGGATGAAPRIFRDNISVPTIPALARARHHLDRRGVSGDVTLIVTGGLRVPSDFVKALALGADGIALANSAIQAVGCIGARMCNTNRCPSGVATQDPALRALIDVDAAAKRVERFFAAAVDLMKTMARACGHDNLSKFHRDDIATWHKEIADLTGIDYAGLDADRAR
jgi:glutamate synthase domain-containing protein 2/CDGSH-type Zn-finger protein/ferredoxin